MAGEALLPSPLTSLCKSQLKSPPLYWAQHLVCGRSIPWSNTSSLGLETSSEGKSTISLSGLCLQHRLNQLGNPGAGVT